MTTVPHGLDVELLKGALDLHVHTSPSRDPRPWSDLDAARSLREAGMRGLVLKDHHGGTAVRAHHTRIAVPEVEAFGSLCLNLAAGGLDPFVVEAQLDYGAKVIWMPTVDSRHHAEYFGGTSVGGYAPASRLESSPISVTGPDGRLRRDLAVILDLIAEADVAVQTGHLGLDEQRTVLQAALDAGVGKIIVTHANFKATRMPLDMQIEFTRRGVMVEYCFWVGRWHSQPPSETVEWIRAVGADRVVLSSDSGSYWSAHPAEHLRMFVSALLMEGLEPDAISQMIHTNPATLLGVDPRPPRLAWS
jgi:hypothetical protein